MKKFWSILTVAFTALLIVAGFANLNRSTVKAASNKKVLVVYFSRTKGVYGGPLKNGNTDRVANFIKQRTNADTYEIVPAKSYPSNYDQTTKVAQREQRRNARPAIKGQLLNVKKYDTIFIGAPIWWGEYPMVVRTFLDKENGLNGKTLIPFTTSEGSGLGNASSQLKKQFPNAKVRKGFNVRGTTVKNNPNKVKTQVNNWLKGLGY